MHQIAIDIYLHAFFYGRSLEHIVLPGGIVDNDPDVHIRKTLLVPGDGLGDIVGKLPFPAGMRNDTLKIKIKISQPKSLSKACSPGAVSISISMNWSMDSISVQDARRLFSTSSLSKAPKSRGSLQNFVSILVSAIRYSQIRRH